VIRAHVHIGSEHAAFFVHLEGRQEDSFVCPADHGTMQGRALIAVPDLNDISLGAFNQLALGSPAACSHD
jgi:hypothetical protein